MPNSPCMNCGAQQLAHSRQLLGVFWILARKVGQTDLVLACNQGSLVGLCTQDYKFPCAAVTICSIHWLTSRHTSMHTHRQHFDQLMKSSAS